MSEPLDLLTNPRVLLREIVERGGYTAGDAERRWAHEEAELGWNVRKDVARFGVTPHVYDDAMERLYREGDGFIFETLQYWCTEGRQGWSRRGLARLIALCDERGIARSDLRLLMLGDGTGSDTLYLYTHGFRPHYFDVPGSRTSAFSRARIAVHGAADSVVVIDDFASLLHGRYDAVWSFDVLEHLPQLPEAVLDIGRMLDDDGVAIITESCRDVRPDLPTHLEVNRQYDRRMPALFRAAGLHLSGFRLRTGYRPCLYRKIATPTTGFRLRSWFLSLAVTLGWFR